MNVVSSLSVRFRPRRTMRKRCDRCRDSGMLLSSTESLRCPCVDKETPPENSKLIISDLKGYSRLTRLTLPCKICMEQECEIMYSKCKHIVGCKSCVENTEIYPGIFKCALCNRLSDTIVRVYIG
jgi:hypothetical protein